MSAAQVSAPLPWPRQAHAAARHVQELGIETGSDFSYARPTQYLNDLNLSCAADWREHEVRSSGGECVCRSDGAGLPFIMSCWLAHFAFLFWSVGLHFSAIFSSFIVASFQVDHFLSVVLLESQMTLPICCTNSS